MFDFPSLTTRMNGQNLNRLATVALAAAAWLWPAPAAHADPGANRQAASALLLITDCNANGVPDDIDVAGGVSEDCNTNGIPDECDLEAPTASSTSVSPYLPVRRFLSATSIMTVPEGGRITDVKLGLRIDHGRQGDLVVTLAHGNVTQTLIDQAGLCNGTYFGYSADNFGFGGNLLVLDDGAPVGIDCYAGTDSDGLDSFSGRARPSEPLSAFNGLDPSGEWTLTVSDLALGYHGTLVTWRLDLQSAAADCNSNGVPDECDTDCNSNGRPDECDIAGGSSRDDGTASGSTAHDGIPDECEVTTTGPVLLGAVTRKTNPRGLGGFCDLFINRAAGGTITSEPRDTGITQVRFVYDGPPTGNVTVESDCSCPSPPAYAPASAAASCAPSGNTLECTFAPALANACTYRLTVPSGAATASVELRGLIGDVNDDGRVNSTDRSRVVAHWTGIFACGADLNADGLVNATDRSIIVAAWTGTGTRCAP